MSAYEQDKLNEALLEFTKSLGVSAGVSRLADSLCSWFFTASQQEINVHNEQTVESAQQWNFYTRNVRLNLENEGKLEEPI